MTETGLDPAGAVPSDLTCPTCHGVLRSIPRLPVLTYRCRTGHQFTIDSLVPAMADDLEEGLWAILRLLEEAIDAEREHAETWRARNEPDLSRAAEERANRHVRQMEFIRAAIELD